MMGYELSNHYNYGFNKTLKGNWTISRSLNFHKTVLAHQIVNNEASDQEIFHRFMFRSFNIPRIFQVKIINGVFSQELSRQCGFTGLARSNQ